MLHHNNQVTEDNTNNKGFTLIELIVSIAVSSIVLMMLMQMIVMSIEARNITYVNSRLESEAYLLVEDIKWRVFDHQTQSVSINETSSAITVTFHHEYDVVIEPGGVIKYDRTSASDEVLVFHKTGANANKITYNGVQMHSDNVYFDSNTTFGVTSVSSGCDPTTDQCENVVLTLTLNISIYTEGGSLVDIKEFETTIII